MEQLIWTRIPCRPVSSHWFLLSSVMSLVVWLLWTLVRVSLGGPVQRVARSEGLDQAKTEPDAARPSFYRLPVFQHESEPLIARELFRPDLNRRPLPAGLTALLLPKTLGQQSGHGTGARAVEVKCGVEDISVRVDRSELRAWRRPSLFRLGSCQASRVTPLFLYFDHSLTECNGRIQVVGGQLVYNFSLHYTPPPQGFVIRVLPLNLPILCHYNRFHYSYKVGFKPQVHHRTFMKSMRSKLSFSLRVCNGQWDPLPTGHWFSLGEPVYFAAHAGALLAGERLYVDSCYVTSSKDPNSTPKVDIITNYGCMTDSRREDSSSHFLQREDDVVKFSVDSFLFSAASQMLYLHCSMSVGLASSFISKSCNYNKTAYRWEELESQPSVCSCCDSTCTSKQDSINSTVSSPAWFIGQEAEAEPRMPFQSEETQGWIDQEERTDEIEEHLDKVQTSPKQMERWRNHEEKETEPFSERTSVLASKETESVRQQQEKKKEADDTREVVVEMEDQLTNLKMFGLFMSDQSRPEEEDTFQSREEVPANNVSESALSSKKSSAGASRTGSGATIITITPSSGIDSGNTSSHGSAQNISIILLPTVRMCPNSTKISCGTTNTIHHERISSSAGQDDISNEVSAETFYNLTARDSTSSPGSIWDAEQSSVTSNIDIDPPGLPEVRQSGKGQQGSEKMDTLLLLQRFILANPVADFDTGNEESEVLHQVTKKKDFPDSIPGLNGVGSGSDGSEQVHEEGPVHSAATVVTTFQGSDGSLMSEREWAEVLLGWGLQLLHGW